MTDFNKLADALRSPNKAVRVCCATMEAESILRAAGAADVAGLMDVADRYALAQADPAHWRAALESALRLALVGREWQPIETAPKDGRQLILLLTPSGFPQVAYSNTWWTAGFSVECKPTHWMPLPAAAPQAKEQTA